MMHDDKKRVVTITLTQSCNLSCIYCYETHKTNHAMSFEQAKSIIDFEFSRTAEDVLLEIDLFGGEPFLEFLLIKKTVEYVQSTYGNRLFLFFIITNGTLLNSDSKAWLIDNRDCVICGLSFDGTKEMQNTNRCNSFDMVDLDFFATTYPGQTVKMTVSPQTLGNLAEGVLFLQSKGFEVTCNLAYGIDWSNDTFCQILERELSTLIAYYMDHPEVPICSMLDMGIEQLAYSAPAEKSRYCGAGIDMVAYDVDGTSYPCQMFMPLSAGSEKAERSKNIEFQEVIPADILDPKCRTCVINAICPTCYGSNYISTGNIYLHESSYCSLMKVIMKARSYLKGLLWKAGRLNLSLGEEANLLKSILILQQEL